MPELNPFNEWLRPEELAALAQGKFDESASVRWAIRRYQAELAAAGAISKINRRWFVHRDLFPRTIIALGVPAAEGRP